MMSSLFAPVHLRPFRRLIAAYGVNALGTWLGEIALAVLVLRETRSAAAVSAVWVAAQFVPSLFAAPLVARLERVPTSRGLRFLLFAEAALFAVLAAGGGDLSLAVIP